MHSYYLQTSLPFWCEHRTLQALWPSADQLVINVVQAGLARDHIIKHGLEARSHDESFCTKQNVFKPALLGFLL